MNPKVSALIAKAREAREARENTPKAPIKLNLDSITNKIITAQFQGNIVLNSKQQEAVDLAKSGKSFCLVGAAGTGKTTTTKEIIASLEVPPLESAGHKHLTVSGTPGVIGISFTRSAVANLRRAMPANMKHNCLTFHALLEYAPIMKESIDEEGNLITVKIFEPRRGLNNPLDPSIKVIIVDEASMPSVELFQQVLDALHHKVQFIFLGDINQLPPVMGTAILGYAMLDLPVVQLIEVYRNAGPIVALAHRVLSGKPINKIDYPKYEVKDKVKLTYWKKKLYQEHAVEVASKMVCQLIDNKLFDPVQDIILIPFNKGFGTIEINKHIADHLTKVREEKTYEVITGYGKTYFAVGDKILYNKEEGVITEINLNTGYLGRATQPASIYLDRWGVLNAPSKTNSDNELLDNTTTDFADIDNLLDNMGSGDREEGRRQASHTVTIQMKDSEDTITLSASSEINNLLLSYALTVHKSQGSEWRNVIFLSHHSNATMLSRELLYTAITRAKLSITIVGEADLLVKGILSQRIKGDVLEDKIEFFKGKAINTDLSRLRFS